MIIRTGGAPFDSDVARGWLDSVKDDEDWDAVIGAFHSALSRPGGVRAEDAIIAIAAADVVAQAVSSRSAPDPEHSVIQAFIGRAGHPPALIVEMAADALAVATGTNSALYEVWAEADAAEWVTRNAIVARALRGETAPLPGAEYAGEWGDPVDSSTLSLRVYSWNALLLSMVVLEGALLVVFVMTLARATGTRVWASGLGGIAVGLVGASLIALGIAQSRSGAPIRGFGAFAAGVILVLCGVAFRIYLGGA